MTTVSEYAEDNKTLTTYVVRAMFAHGTPVTVNQELTDEQITFLNTKKPWPSKGQRAPVKQAVYSSRTADKFVVRLSDGLRERIHKLSTEKHRSMNSQIIHYLEMCVELDENSESGINKDALIKLFEESNMTEAVIVPYQQPNYTPAPGCPVRVKNDGGVWLVRNYVARGGVVKAILECFVDERRDENPALLDVAIDQLEPV